MKTVNVKSLGDCPYLISLESEDVIGHGSYAQVCRSYNKHIPEEKLAAKIFDLSDAKKFQSALRELKFVSELPKHVNLVDCKRVKISSENRVYIIMELCKSNLKKKIMQRKQPFPQQEIWRFLFQFCEGYKILYNKKIIHRDIKPDNILIGFDQQYKIADLGLAEVVSVLQRGSKVKGSLCYLAPQLLSNDGHVSNMNDVYSLGVTVYQMCFKKLPFVKNVEALLSINRFIHQVKTSTLDFPTSFYSSKLLNLIGSMLQKQPTKRCTWQYIFFILTSSTQMPYISPYSPQPEQLQQPPNKKFRIVQISDAILKNLSNLDTELYQSLTNQSLVVIDHVEADIISKRQIVYFCDRLQYRIQIIRERGCHDVLGCFGGLLLRYAYWLSKNLDQYFQNFYQKIEKSEFLKIITTQKYTFLRNLVKQDHQALKNLVDQATQICEEKKRSQNGIRTKNEAKNVEAELYEVCFDTILTLYRQGLYEQCKQVDELQKWLQRKQKSEGLLSKLRKNENALKQFDESTAGMTRERLKQVISKAYVYRLAKLDKEDQRQSL